MNAPRDACKEIPWWLQGDEQCDWCLQSYALEVEYRCERCDAAVCPDCVVEIRLAQRTLCGPCAEAYAAETNPDRSHPK